MGWFDNQIKERKKEDDISFSKAFSKISSAVTGKVIWNNKLESIENQTKIAVDEILRYYRIEVQDEKKKFESIEEILEHYLQPSGLYHRRVALKGKWYRDGFGPLLAYTKSGEPKTLIPKKIGGYQYLDYETGKRRKVTKAFASQLETDAVCFYYPFETKKLSVKDLFQYMFRVMAKSDFIVVAVFTLLMSAIGLIPAILNQILFGNMAQSGKVSALLPIFLVFLCTIFGTTIMEIGSNLMVTRISTKLTMSVQSAVMMRILSLPVEFFRKYSTGELVQRIQCLEPLCEGVVNVLCMLCIPIVYFVVYGVQIFGISSALFMAALLQIFLYLIVVIAKVVVQGKIEEKGLLYGGRQRGTEYSLIQGVQKIKVSGAEKRAFAKWADSYEKTASLRYNPPFFIKSNRVFFTAINLMMMLVIFYMAIKSNISSADYMAFAVAYGMINAACLYLINAAQHLTFLRPIFKMIEPILQEEPEVSKNRKMVTRLSGRIELNHVSFRYQKEMPWILNDMSIKISSGEYVAIVGKTGCGKSTLLRLLLGFENAKKGAIYYDGKDIKSMDLRSLRKKIGVVTQDGKLFQGDIYSNIAVSAPGLSVEAAWEAAELAGVANDIRDMPMGMQTLISEGDGGISGGQKQRIMIARAIASKPKILLLDEATSALDNITQKQVSDSLAKLSCTRIVIAHRLSTIQQCERIIVIDGGRVIEEGDYETLMAAGKFFSSLVKQQI